MAKAKAGYLKKLIQLEKAIESAPKTYQFLIFGFCFILALSVGLLVAFTFRKWTDREINKQKQEIVNMEKEQMDGKVEEFRNSL